jgi:cytosine/adenosine deaminase-related metal-dependent hydrolase
VARACGNRGRAISTPVRLSADWLFTGAGEVIPFGALLTDSHGRILAAGPHDLVPFSPLIKSEHFAGAALMPGLVNAHTHLELTGLEGKAGESDFDEWIRTIVRLKHKWAALDFLQAARTGLQRSFAAGVTTLADTGDSGAPFEVLLEQNGSGIAYLEVFGPDPFSADTQFDAFRTRALELKARQTERVRLGVSPHAPYSVSGLLYSRVARFAEEEGLPMAVHIAESAAESELLEHADGPFARQWESRGIPLPSLPGRTPLAWLDEHGVLGPRTLCIHVVRAQGDDITRLARQHCPVAHCPRSNRRHGHGDAPLGKLLAAGLRVGVGTDSAASVYPVDLLAEARAAQALAGLTAERALDLVMLGAARALNLDLELGSLALEKFADCTIIGLPPGIQAATCAEAILASRPEDVKATFVGGREVHRRP